MQYDSSQKIKDLISKVAKDRQFQQRKNAGELADMWNEILGDDLGELCGRDGDVLLVKVKGAPLKSELENFRKWDILEILHMHQEFSAIRDIRFMEM